MKREDPLQLESVWHGICLQFSTLNAKELSNSLYEQTLDKIEDTGPHSFSAVLQFSINQDETETLETLRTEVFKKTLTLFTGQSYSVEYKEVKLPFCDIVAAEATEFCLVISEQARIRCFVLYDFDFRLSRIILLRECREEAIKLRTDKERRLAIEEYCGHWTGQGVWRKLTKPDHEEVAIHSDVRILWDGETAIRKSICIRNLSSEESATQDNRDSSDFKSERWLYLRDNSQNAVTSYGSLVNEFMVTFSVDLEQNVLFLLPFDCFVQAPNFLHADHAFHFEFGCMIKSGCRKRLSRIYSRRGFPVSGMLALEQLSY
ncbi:hypothetical protein GpartN1_g966.t1 [Galdieria partita]|uniref:Biogenesis factor required for ATP synthase 1-like C-terminal domain-containing protein n=1 Tax=Galdieria partita TaxID=83374 RepID=A0A9C7UMV8_9RHOD|nr:hypothetical protein GpartN1_g966.t1 [Galdieria partita]